MLSSQNYMADKDVLRSGEIITPDLDLDTLKDPSAKVYRHTVPGARFFMPDGASIIFQGGVFVTKNPDIIKELDKVADKGGTMITTDEAALAKYRTELKIAALDASRPASEGGVVTDEANPALVVDDKPVINI